MASCDHIEVIPMYAEMLLPEFDEEMKSTRKLLECFPEGKSDWKPHEKSMSLGRLAGHVAELPGFAYQTMAVETLEFDKPGSEPTKPFIATSRDQLLKAFDENVAKGRQAIAGAKDEDMGTIWTLIYQGRKVFALPRAAVMRAMVMNHLIHHRGQLGVYLRMNDIAIPGVYGPSADDKNPTG